MRREERVTVQGPVKEQQPDGMSHRGCGGGGRREQTGGLNYLPPVGGGLSEGPGPPWPVWAGPFGCWLRRGRSHLPHRMCSRRDSVLGTGGTAPTPEMRLRGRGCRVGLESGYGRLQERLAGDFWCVHTRNATNARQGNWLSVAIGPVPKATQ